MSIYTDARSKPGRKGTAGTDERELMMRGLSDTLLTAHEENRYFLNHAYSMNITAGQSQKFPTLGRIRTQAEHVPGEILLGGDSESNEKEISLDNIVVASHFIAEIDELMLNYDLMAPIANQLGEAIAVQYDRRTAIAHVKAARVTTPDYVGGPTGQRILNAAMKTDPAVIEASLFSAAEYLLANDLGLGGARAFFAWKEYLLLSKYTGIDNTVTSGSGNRSEGTVGGIAGLRPEGANHIPNTNIVSGLTKYQGNFSTTVGFISKPNAVGRLKRRGLKMVIKKQDDRLGTLLIASALEGLGTLRQENAVELATS